MCGWFRSGFGTHSVLGLPIGSGLVAVGSCFGAGSSRDSFRPDLNEGGSWVEFGVDLGSAKV